MSERISGKVKWFDGNKGYGFITPNDKTIEGGKDIFVHANDLNGVDLADGDVVTFTIEQPGPKGKGPKAKEVQVAAG